MMSKRRIHSLSSLPLKPQIRVRKRSSIFLKPADSIKWFPSWLIQRNDFKQYILKFDNLQKIDIASTCQKPPHQRDEAQKLALKSWYKRCVFSKSLSQYLIDLVCDKLQTKYYSKGQKIMNQGQIGDFMCFIVKGNVQVKRNGHTLGIMGPWNSIGQAALQNSQVRSADIQAIDNVTVLLLSNQDYNQIILKQKPTEKFKALKMIKKVKFFDSLPIKKLQRIVWRHFYVQYDQNEIIYNIGDEPLHFFIIQEGEVRIQTIVTLKSHNIIPTGRRKLRERLVSQQEYSKEIRTCRSLQFFGEDELIKQIPRRTKAVCTTSTILLILPAKDFRQILNQRQKKELAAANPPIMDAVDLQKQVRNEIRKRTASYRAILAASDISPLPQGRLFQERKTDKKAIFAKNIFSKYCYDLNRRLVSSKYSLVKSQ